MSFFNKYLRSLALFLIALSLLMIGSQGSINVVRFFIKEHIQKVIGNVPDSKLIAIQMLYTSGSENEDEIIVEGEYFDVAKCTINGNFITYYCYPDEAETNLSQASSLYFDCTSSSKIFKNHLSNIHPFRDTKYLHYTGLLSVDVLGTKTISYGRNQQLIDVDVEVITPPPRIV